MFFIHGRGIISNVEFNISSRTLAPFRTRQRNDQDHKSDSPNAHGLQIKQNIFVELNHRILSRYSSCVLRCSEVFEYNMKLYRFLNSAPAVTRAGCWVWRGWAQLSRGQLLTSSAAAGPQFRGTLKLFTTFLNICTALFDVVI